MTAPNYSISQFPHRNPDATSPLLLTMIVVPNTSPEQIAANVVANAALPLQWLTFKDVTDRAAIMVGGGPSAADHIETIRTMQAEGGIVYAMNGASAWLRRHGIVPDWQVVADAKPETATLVDPWARGHLFSSAVNPATMTAVAEPVVWHPVLGGIEECFPEHRRTAEYSIVGGTSAGTHGMCAAYVLGHREFHCFGYDSSHRGHSSHAYSQPMNDDIPCVEVEWAGKTYLASVAMKAQAEHFQTTAREMQKLGCTITVHGEGLLPAMWNTPPHMLTEKDKYRLIWQHESYRNFSPGEHAADTFLEVAKPNGRIVDFGCGTGRAAVKMASLGHDVLLVDFADNCRDHEAIALPFLEWDLTRPFTFTAPYGFCTDVMEHIPPQDVDTVLCNIMGAANRVFFQISTVPDQFGALIHQTLHLTVRPAEWWLDTIERLGFVVEWIKVFPAYAQFVVSRKAPQ